MCERQQNCWSDDHGKKTHIWILNHYAISPDLAGGTRHYSLAKELVNMGFEVTIFASNVSHAEKRAVRLQNGGFWSIESINGVKFIWLKSFLYSRNNWRRVLNVLSYFFMALLKGINRPKCLHKPDIVIGSSVHLLAVLAGRLFAWYYDTKFIAEIRDLWPQTLIDSGAISETGLIARLMRCFEFFLYNHADHIITLLPLAPEYICQRGIPKSKVSWISNGVDLSDNTGVAMKIKEQPKTHFKIFYTGSHGIYDDLDTIVECAIILQKRNIKYIKFVLVGDGIAKNQLIMKAKENNLVNIEFCEPVAKHLIQEVLQEADACILVNMDIPLYQYGISSNKLFDYLAAGKPVIMVGNVVENPVEKAHSGITVKPDNPELLAAACMDLSSMDVAQLIQWGANGRRYVEQYYSYTYLAAHLAGIINSLCTKATH